MHSMSDRQTIPVVITSADAGFAMPCAVMLRSVADNLTWTHEVRAVVLDVGLTARDRRNIRASLRFTRVRVDFFELEQKALEEVKVDGHVSRATYARLVGIDLLRGRFQ